MSRTSIVLVPGWWLGAWAWDDVADRLRADGHSVTALTLPGLDSADTDRSAVTFDDHVDAIVAAVEAEAAAAGEPVVLAVHSGSGGPGYAASDRVPHLIRTLVYVDSAPATGPGDPDFADVEKPLPPWDELDENLDGISDAQLATFRERAVPQPGGLLRGGPTLTNDARLDVPSVVLCTAFPSSDYRAEAERGSSWCGGLRELRDLTWVDLPTSHWPMWSRPAEVAALLSDVANGEPVG